MQTLGRKEVIGLLFLGAVSLWFLFVFQLSKCIPKWLGISRHKSWFSFLMLLVLLVLPLADHLIGMLQFQNLCSEQTAIQIDLNAANAKRAMVVTSPAEFVEGKIIPIKQQISKIMNLDTGEQIAQYKYFSTPGGRIGRLAMLGGEHSCAADQPRNADYKKFKSLATQINLTYGVMK